MSLTDKEKMHIKALIERRIEPSNGMEVHFLNVLNGKGRPCTGKEKE